MIIGQRLLGAFHKAKGERRGRGRRESRAVWTDLVKAPSRERANWPLGNIPVNTI